MDTNLKIPDNKRHEYSQPLGKLITGKREETIPEVENIIRKIVEKKSDINFYLVGDIVTQDFLSNSFLKSFIKLCIIDGKTQRNRIDIGDENFFESIIEFQSPQGSIPKESWSVLRKIIQTNKRTLLKITEGEEDLLVLPLALEIPLEKNIKKFIFYGQPPITDSKTPIPEGIVMVELNRTIQKAVKNFVSKMESS